MALARNDKERIVSEVKEVASKASSLVISDARGLKVSELTEIRRKATDAGIHIQVIKNSLAKLAFDGTDFGCTNEVLSGPSLLSFDRSFAQFQLKIKSPIYTTPRGVTQSTLCLFHAWEMP